MNNLGALALRYLKVNKRQSVFIVICASLSVALCAFFLTAFSSGFATVRENVSELYGSWHGFVGGLTKKQVDNIAANAAFSHVQIEGQMRRKAVITLNDYGGYDISSEEFGDGLEYFLYACGSGELIEWDSIFTAENLSDPIYSHELVSGKFPESPYEIVMPCYADVNLGDKITVTVKSHERIYSMSGLIRPGKLVKSYEKTYTVCGLAKNEDFSHRTYIHPDDDFFCKGLYEMSYNLYVRFANKRDNYRTLLLDLCGREGVPIVAVNNRSERPQYLINYSINLNDELLMAEAAGSEAIVDMTTAIALMCVFLMIILAFGRVVIDCEFEQIAASKQHDIGLLMAIGATDRQLYAVSIFEGLILGSLAVPTGLILGVGLAWLAVKIINGFYYMRDILPALAVFELDPLLLLLAAVFGIGWVFFSAYGIGVNVKKVNPVEAISGVRKSGRSPYPEQNAKNPEFYKKLNAAFILTPVKKNAKGGNERTVRRVILTPFDKLSPENFLQKLSAAVARIERKRFWAASASMAMGIFLFNAVFFGIWTVEHDLFREIGYYPVTEEEADANFSGAVVKYMPYERASEYFDEKIEQAKEHGIILTKNTYWNIGDDRDVFNFVCTAGDKYGNFQYYDEAFFKQILNDCGISYEEAEEKNYVFIQPQYSGGNTDSDPTYPPVITVEEAELNIEVYRLGWYGEENQIWGMQDEGYKETPLQRKVTAVYINKGEGGKLSKFYSDGVSEETRTMESVIVNVSKKIYDEVLEETVKLMPEKKNYSRAYSCDFKLSEGTNRQEAENWLRENFGRYEVTHYYVAPLEYVIFEAAGIILAVTAALIAFANAINVTMSGILENRRGFALMRAAGMTDRQLESSALRQAAEPVIWAAVISFVLFSVFMFNIWAEFYDYFTAFNILAGYAAYAAGVAVTLGVSLLAALPAIREIENEEIAVGVKPMVE
ncbi:MAG: ABC transporter permease [Oscillospiraceae bacterium]|nr:ABC transporter permease [Oscillospiraceae bacterium]